MGQEVHLYPVGDTKAVRTFPQVLRLPVVYFKKASIYRVHGIHIIPP
jgi:hypothetical protein